MPSFVIVTVDGTTYHEGESASMTAALKDIGADRETLDGYVFDAGDVVLRYGTYTLRIPEARINYIAARD